MGCTAVVAVGASGYFPAMHKERTGLEVTRRALVLGAGAALFLNLACPYTVLVLQNAGLTSDYLAAGAMMVFLLLVGLVNPLLKIAFRAWALRTSELVVVYAMMVVASAIPTWGLVTNLCHILTRPFYYATPENRWAELIQPLIPSWLAPHEAEVARFFYEGLPEGMGIPWGAWLVPLVAWGSAMVAIYLLMIATMVVFRRPWVEQERLVFPLAQVPLEMLRGNDEGIFPELFRNPLMWVGFALPFAIQVLDGLNHYFFFVPEVRLVFDPLTLFRDSVRLHIFVNFAIIGVAYFLNLNVAFSVWFFPPVKPLPDRGFQRHRLSGQRAQRGAHRFFGGPVAPGDGSNAGAGSGDPVDGARPLAPSVQRGVQARGTGRRRRRDSLLSGGRVAVDCLCDLFPRLAAAERGAGGGGGGVFLWGICHFLGHCAGHRPRRRGLYLFDHAAAALCGLYLGHGRHRLEGGWRRLV